MADGKLFINLTDKCSASEGLTHPGTQLYPSNNHGGHPLQLDGFVRTPQFLECPNFIGRQSLAGVLHRSTASCTDDVSALAVKR